MPISFIKNFTALKSLLFEFLRSVDDQFDRFVIELASILLRRFSKYFGIFFLFLKLISLPEKT